jgi:hypothetical protein
VDPALTPIRAEDQAVDAAVLDDLDLVSLVEQAQVD